MLTNAAEMGDKVNGNDVFIIRRFLSILFHDLRLSVDE